jgi:hypothetical protein
MSGIDSFGAGFEANDSRVQKSDEIGMSDVSYSDFENLPGSSNTTDTPLSEADQVAQMLQKEEATNYHDHGVQEDISSFNNESLPEKQLDAGPNDTKEKTLHKSIENNASQTAIFSDLRESQLVENQSVTQAAEEAADRGEEFTKEDEQDIRIEHKGKVIEEKKEEGFDDVATSVILLDDREPPPEQQKTLQLRENLKEDLKNVNLSVFYKQYFAVMQGADGERPQGLRMLESQLGQSLNAAAQLRGAEPYSTERVHEIFLALTTSDQLERYAVILYEERLRVALQIDRKLGTDVYGAVQKIFNTGSISPDQKLKKVDALLDELAKIKTQDQELQAKLDELKGFNAQQKETTAVLELQISEERLNLELRAQQVRTTIETINRNFATMPEDDIRLFSDHIEEGRYDLVNSMLEGGSVKKMPDGSYAGAVKGETVFIAQRNGKLAAFLKAGEREIPILRTEPNAVGFDLARSEKIAVGMGWEDVGRREDIRWYFLEKPGDGEFMDERQANKFQFLLYVIVGEKGTDASAALRSLSLLREDGSVHEKFVDALKATFDKWAPNRDYASLRSVVKPADLQTLVQLWQAEDLSRNEESQMLRIYTLEELRGEPAID